MHSINQWIGYAFIPLVFEGAGEMMVAENVQILEQMNDFEQGR